MISIYPNHQPNSTIDFFMKFFYSLTVILAIYFPSTLSAKINTSNKFLQFPSISVDSMPTLYEVVMIELKRREGFASQPYLDGEMWALGYGQHYKNWSEVPNYPLNERQATEVLNKSLEKEFRNIAAQFPHLEQNEKWALTSIAYNVGITTIKTDSVFWAAIQQKNMPKLKQIWLENYAATTNHKRSRELEWAIFTNDVATIKKMYDEAYEVVKMRYEKKLDFSMVRMRKK